MLMDLKPYRTALFTLHDRHEILAGLHEIHGDLDIVSFWKLFREAWCQVKSLYTNQTHIRDMLTSERLNSPGRLACMTGDEIRYLKRASRFTMARAKKKGIKVYRGGSMQNITGFSWTQKRAVAVEHARRCGQETGNVVVGYVQPHSVILFLDNRHEIIAFPEDVTVDHVEDAPGMRGEELSGRRIQALVEAFGANYVMQMTPEEYFVDAMKAANADKAMVLEHMDGSATFLEPLGFKERVKTVKGIARAIREMDDGVRGS
mgnify:CR=1 FL=1